MDTAHLEIHGEQQAWLAEAALWRSELTVWLREVDEALDGVKDLENLVRNHRGRLQREVAELEAEELSMKNSQHRLAQAERVGQEAELGQLSNEHQEACERHFRTRAAHANLKKRHHTSLSHWIKLFKVLSAKN